MSNWTWKQWSALAWCLAFCPILASAQDDIGVVRISDGAKPGAPKAGVYMTGHKKTYDYSGASGYAGSVGYMNGGDCPCPQCHGVGCPHCKHHGHLAACMACKFQEHYCCNSPDYGFSIPGKWPIERRGVQYLNYFPSSWYGANGPGVAPVAYPMVYTPTDTAQLGYYYQHVPFWMPQPNPLPQRPLPARWHNYAPPVTSSIWASGGMYGGPIVGGTPVNGTPTPINDGTVQPVATMDTPPAPKPPMNETAIDTPFRRASLAD